MRRTTYELIRNMVREQTGIVLEDGKHSLVRTRLLPIARAYGLRNVDELCSQLPRNHQLREEVIEAMTTNETRFFRDLVPFAALADVVLPEVIQRRAESRTLSIWSSACSTGQEPYSIAMLIHERFPELAGWNIQILATDLSRKVLARAEEGRYRRVDVGRGLSPEQLARFFDEEHDLWSIKPHLRQRITFRYHNLTVPWPRLPLFDVVFLRNVLIYFDLDVKRQVMQRVWDQTAEQGYLFLGASERPPTQDGGWRQLPIPRSGCYQRMPSRTAGSDHPSLITHKLV